MTTPPVPDARTTYRTELEQPSAGGDRWSLYVDGRLIAHSEHPMDDVAARAWANSQLGEGVTWLNGRIDPTETWYWVANPALHHAQRPNTDPHPDQDRLLRPFGRSTGRRTPPPPTRQHSPPAPAVPETCRAASA